MSSTTQAHPTIVTYEKPHRALFMADEICQKLYYRMYVYATVGGPFQALDSVSKWVGPPTRSIPENWKISRAALARKNGDEMIFRLDEEAQPNQLVQIPTHHHGVSKHWEQGRFSVVSCLGTPLGTPNSESLDGVLTSVLGYFMHRTLRVENVKTLPGGQVHWLTFGAKDPDEFLSLVFSNLKMENKELDAYMIHIALNDNMFVTIQAEPF